MSFGTVQAAYGQLKKRLAVYVGPQALSDITIDPPKGTNDELSFIRLVAWGYVLLHEAGRVPLGFLRQLPPWSEPMGTMLPHIRCLRTWTSHNLALDKAVDIATFREAIQWFSATCGVGSPVERTHWQRCYEKLCGDLVDLLRKAVSACDAFESKDDMQRLTDELMIRLDRDWDAYRFDQYVERACAHIGYQSLDIVRFRSNNVQAWRKVVANSLPDGVERNIRLRIEADIVTLMGNALPLTGEELSGLLRFDSKNGLVAALLTLRTQEPSERHDIVNLIRRFAQNIEAHL